MSSVRRSWLRSWLATAGVALLAAAVVNGALVVLGVEHDAALITLHALASAATGVLLVTAADAHTALPWTSQRTDARPDPGEDTRTAMFRHTVEVHLTSREHDDAIVWQLADLAARRLRQVHGLRYADDPARATELLGPQLAGWVALDRRDRYRPDHRGRRLTVAELSEVVRRIEEL